MLLYLHKQVRSVSLRTAVTDDFAVLAQGVGTAFLQKEEKHEKNKITHYMDGKYKGNLVAHF